MKEPTNQLVKIGFNKEDGKYWAKIICTPAINTIWASSIQELHELIILETSQDPRESQFFDGCSVQIKPVLYYEIDEMAAAVGTTAEVWINSMLQDVIASKRLIEVFG